MKPNTNAYVNNNNHKPKGTKSADNPNTTEDTAQKKGLSIDDQLAEFAKIILNIYFESIEPNEINE